MARLALLLSALAAAGAFGAVGLTFALAGAGVPYVVATAVVALIAGAAAFAVLHLLVVRPLAPLGTAAPGALAQDVAQQRARLAALEAMTSSLRHDLRGLLSPAMLVSDRLVSHADPKVVRSGETVVRAITRAAERLAATRAPAPGDPPAPSPAPPSVSPQEPQPGAHPAAHQHDGVLPERARQRLDSARGG